MPLKTGNDSIPLIEGWMYLITPGGVSQQWVEIINISPKGIVSVKGMDNTIADWSLPSWHFDDIIVEYKEFRPLMLTEDGLFFLTTEANEILFGQ